MWRPRPSSRSAGKTLGPPSAPLEEQLVGHGDCEGCQLHGHTLRVRGQGVCTQPCRGCGPFQGCTKEAEAGRLLGIRVGVVRMLLGGVG